MSAKPPLPPRKPEPPKAAEALLADPELARRGLVAVGVVGRPLGLGGGFFVSGRRDPIPMSYSPLLVGATPASAQPLCILESRMQGERPALRLEGVRGREAAQALTGHGLWVELARARVQSETWLWSDLLGVRVVDSAGVELGTVSKVYNAGASDVVEVRGAKGTLDVPMVAAYVDLVPRSPGVLRLVVAAAVFEEAWESAGPRRPARGEREE